MMEQGRNLSFDGSPQLGVYGVSACGVLLMVARIEYVRLHGPPGTQDMEVLVGQFDAFFEEQPAVAVAHIGGQDHSGNQVFGGHFTHGSLLGKRLLTMYTQSA